MASGGELPGQQGAVRTGRAPGALLALLAPVVTLAMLGYAFLEAAQNDAARLCQRVQLGHRVRFVHAGQCLVGKSPKGSRRLGW